MTKECLSPKQNSLSAYEIQWINTMQPQKQVQVHCTVKKLEILLLDVG